MTGRQPETGLIFSLLVELHDLLLLLHLVVGIKLLQLLDLGLHFLHPRHRQVGAAGQREEQALDDQGDDEDGDAEIADELVDRLQQPEHRPGDEVEIAPVDQHIEFRDAERVLVIIENLGFLGAGEDAGGQDGGLAGRENLGVAKDVGLELRLHAGELAEPAFVVLGWRRG